MCTCIIFVLMLDLDLGLSLCSVPPPWIKSNPPVPSREIPYCTSLWMHSFPLFMSLTKGVSLVVYSGTSSFFRPCKILETFHPCFSRPIPSRNINLGTRPQLVFPFPVHLDRYFPRVSERRKRRLSSIVVPGH